jgi:hypothetical protein
LLVRYEMKKMSNETGKQSSGFSRPTPGVFVPFLWGMGFVVLGVGLWQYGPIIATGYNVLLPYGFSIFLILLGLATLWSCIYQLALRRVPAARITIPNNRFRLGEGNEVTLIQPGECNLSWLRVRLLCIEKKTTRHKRASRQPDGQLESYTKTSETILHKQSLIETTDLHVQDGVQWEKTETFSIPSDMRPSREGDSVSIVWRVELSGRSSLLMSFLHSFEVQVCA